jgi:hypothetical protein
MGDTRQNNAIAPLPDDAIRRQSRSALPARPPVKEPDIATAFARLPFGAAMLRRAPWASVLTRGTVTEKPIHLRASDSGFPFATHAAAGDTR